MAGTLHLILALHDVIYVLLLTLELKQIYMGSVVKNVCFVVCLGGEWCQSDSLTDTNNTILSAYSEL